jgi:uncharacterized protein (TIGR03435 family)
MNRDALLAGVLGLMGTLPSLAQTDAAKAARPEFEVASIKPHTSSERRIVEMMPLPGGRFNAINATLKLLISRAYGVQDYQLSGGPGWIDSDPYDIVAKTEEGSGAKWIECLQALLEDRFKLTFHRESKEMPAYALVVAKGGPKLHESKEDCPPRPPGLPRLPAPGETPSIPCGGMLMGRNQVSGEKIAISQIATYLSRTMRRPVMDKTALTGKYDIKIEWTPDQNQVQVAPGAPTQSPPESSGPSIFTALQEQLGLKLESQKGLVEVLVIDHVEQPSEN